MRERSRPIHARHHHIQKDQIGRPSGRTDERVASRSAALHRQRGVEAERHLYDLADIGLVIDMQYA